MHGSSQACVEPAGVQRAPHLRSQDGSNVLQCGLQSSWGARHPPPIK